MKDMTLPRRPAALAAVGGLLAALGLAPAGAGAATIDMVGKTDKKLAFEGPAKVAAGKNLRISNSTDPMKVGPHTFTLVEKRVLPTSKKQARACFETGICGAIAAWHEVDMETGEAGKIDVEVGKPGWDRPGNLEREGDSWFTAAEGESTKRKLTAKAGTKLTYFCAIHPNMVGSVKVKDRK